MRDAFILIALISVLAVPGFYVFSQEGVAQVDYRKCWQLAPEDSDFVGLDSDSAATIVSTADAKVWALGRNSGEQLWSSELGGTLISNLSIAGGHVYAVTRSADDMVTLRSLRRETGTASKTVPVAKAERYFAAAARDSLILVSSGGDVYSLSASSGDIVWHRKPTGSVIGRPSIGPKYIVTASTDGRLLTLETSSGEIQSLRKIPSAAVVVFASSEGEIFYGDGRGNLTSVTREWTLRLGARVSDITAVDGELFASSYDNFVYKIEAGNGDVRWRKRMAGRVAGVALAPGHSLLIFALGESNATLAETEKGRTVGQIPLGVALEAAVIPSVFESGSAIAINGDVTSFAAGGCTAKKAPAVTANALQKIK